MLGLAVRPIVPLLAVGRKMLMVPYPPTDLLQKRDGLRKVGAALEQKNRYSPIHLMDLQIMVQSG